MGLLEFQLRALRYPHPVDLLDQEATRKLVLWLENMKIREYKIEDRKALADLQSPTWNSAFSKYLLDLQCPVPPGDLSASVLWLVAFATNLEYGDNADKLASVSRPPASTSAAAAAAAATAGPGSRSGLGSAKPGAAAAAAESGSGSASEPSAATRMAVAESFTDLSDPRVAAAVLQLVRAAGIQGSSGGGGGGGGGAATMERDIVEQLQAAVERLVGCVGPALTPGVWSPAKPAKQVLAEVPLGFEVEGDALRSAATALRLLYIRDLRRLQSQIDHAVVEMQEYTANPKTDSSLGKVGR